MLKLPDDSSPEPSQRAGKARFVAVDAARGAAMLLVFLSHFSRHYYRVVGARQVDHALTIITRLATPAFILLSGMMLGFLRYENRGNFSRMRDKLIDRGLFLLLICHPLIAVTEIPGARRAGLPWYSPLAIEILITDLIGVGLIAGACVVQHAAVRRRLVLGVMLLLVHWTCGVLLPPHGHSAWSVLREVLSGRQRDAVLCYSFPLLPWFGFYLMASGAGELFATWRDNGDHARPVSVALRAGCLAMGFVAVLKIVLRPLKQFFHDGTTTVADRLVVLGFVGEKLPPSMAYVSFYGGLALLGLAGLLALDARDHRERSREPGLVRRWMALVGRNSLVAFVIQAYLYYVGVLLLPKPPLWSSPFYFASTLLVLLAALKLSDLHRMNAYFAVGYARWIRRRRHGGVSVE